MKKIFTLLSLIACSAGVSFAGVALQDTTSTQEVAKLQEPTRAKDTVMEYRRSSLYSVLVKHSKLPYCSQVETAFMAIDTPDKFNNHDLEIKSFESSSKKANEKGEKKEKLNTADAKLFIQSNKIPHRLVGKWFNQDPRDGGFDMDLIAERGYYDASREKILMADNSHRGRQALADAGEDLIGRTFMLVNDITYIDNGEQTAKVSAWTKALGSIAGELTGMSSITDLSSSAATLVNMVDGFTVNVTSYLYRLDWNEQISSTFYQDHWWNKADGKNSRREAFENCPLFNLTYMGSTVAKATNISTKTAFAKPKNLQMLKVCTRAIDKSIVQLQREYDEFKVNVPISNITQDGTVEVPIGLKEGLNEKSEFDVLIAVKDPNNKTIYEKVGRIKPIKTQIWDNRFGALDDANELEKAGKVDQSKLGDEAPGNVALTCSSFKIVSGAGKIFPGCLVREVTIKKS